MYSSLILYLTMVAIGVFVGTKKISQSIPDSLLQKLQVGALIILLLTMGIKIGADDRVFQSLKMIGLSATLITSFSIVFSILGVYILRKICKINMKGEKEND